MKITSKIGAHVSTAGGIQNAPARAAAQGCEIFQCFTRSPQGGKAPGFTEQIVEEFRAAMEAHKIENFYIHAPYYINLASMKPPIRHGSARIIREELERGSILGARYVMVHVGSHAEQTLQEGLEKVITGLGRSLENYQGSTQLLIEISAGSGSVIGDTFKEVGDMVTAVGDMPGFGGVCFDTCHAFASGYDYRTPKGLQGVLKEFDDAIGLEWLKLTHVNDSKGDLNSKKDRHEHVGQGYIGEEGLRNILTSEAFARIDWILETEPEGREADVQKLKEIRGF